ncbi:hypothetical protein KRX19_07410 [Cardiobacteriaceae bacterium TAE3-ERU3]|nr:hypothetical protein [Cardiobacteriaceae bacterium TAE3-ERU3]
MTCALQIYTSLKKQRILLGNPIIQLRITVWLLGNKGCPKVPHSLVWIALVTAAGGTVLLAIAGIRLPGLEFNNQKVEAAYRKELVYGEDFADRAQLPTLCHLYDAVQKNYFRLYINYLYFDLVKWTYLQASVLFPYLALGPTLIAGTITLGLMQQVVRAFGRVEGAFQFLVHSWSTIVELVSIRKRLQAFENQMKE